MKAERLIMLTIVMALCCLSVSAKSKLCNNSKVFNVKGVEFKMIEIPSGSYIAGAQKSDSLSDNYDTEAQADESPVHKVNMKSFMIGETEVTQGLWEAVTGRGPKSEGWSKKYGKGPLYPAYYMSYNEIKNEFLKQLNEYVHTTNQLSDSMNFVLPTEAEWEYAARGGAKKDRYAGGNDIDTVAWYWDNAESTVHQSGEKAPNGYGLKDMSGNLWEWTSDLYYQYFKDEVNNPVVSGVGDVRVLKGGSWMRNEVMNRITVRNQSSQDFEYVDFGFRIVLHNAK